MNRFSLLVICFALVSNIALAGRKEGASIHKDTVLANSTDNYTDVYSADEDTIIRVRGDGSTDIDCEVYDSNGNLVDSDRRAEDVCILTFHPKWTGKFVLKIKNLGSVANEYVLSSN